MEDISEHRITTTDEFNNGVTASHELEFDTAGLDFRIKLTFDTSDPETYRTYMREYVNFEEDDIPVPKWLGGEKDPEDIIFLRPTTQQRVNMNKLWNCVTPTVESLDLVRFVNGNPIHLQHEGRKVLKHLIVNTMQINDFSIRRKAVQEGWSLWNRGGLPPGVVYDGDRRVRRDGDNEFWTCLDNPSTVLHTKVRKRLLIPLTQRNQMQATHRLI